jgi:hypothetical protein
MAKDAMRKLAFAFGCNPVRAFSSADKEWSCLPHGNGHIPIDAD